LLKGVKETFLDLILRTSSNQLGKNGDADYAIVRITPELAQYEVERIGHLRQLKQQDSSLYKMVYSDNTPHFFSWHKDLTEIVDLGLNAVEAVVDSDGYAMLETDYTVPKDYCVAMKGQSMIVYDNHIIWEAYPKNTDIIITTYSVSLELLRGLAIPVDD
jgi:hypothetical protein